MKKSELTGIVLAGGKSSRMGEDKGLVSFRGRTLVEYPLELLSSLCKQVLISTNNQEYNRFGHPLVSDQFTFRAPINGIYSALNKSNTAHNLMIATDMPFVSVALLKRILNHAEGYDMVVPTWPDGKAEPLCGYYNKSILPVLSKQLSTGNYAIKELTKISRCYRMNMNEEERMQFINLNQSQDLERYG